MRTEPVIPLALSGLLFSSRMLNVTVVPTVTNSACTPATSSTGPPLGPLWVPCLCCAIALPTSESESAIAKMNFMVLLLVVWFEWKASLRQERFRA